MKSLSESALALPSARKVTVQPHARYIRKPAKGTTNTIAVQKTNVLGSKRSRNRSMYIATRLTASQGSQTGTMDNT